MNLKNNGSVTVFPIAFSSVLSIVGTVLIDSGLAYYTNPPNITLIDNKTFIAGMRDSDNSIYGRYIAVGAWCPQWGRVEPRNDEQLTSISFPVAFSSVCLNCLAAINFSVAMNGTASVYVHSYTPRIVNIQHDSTSGNHVAMNGYYIFWIAIGV